MPLELAMEFTTKHRSATGQGNLWYNTYGALFPVVPAHATVKTILEELVEVERGVHLNVVRMLGAIANPFRAKTIEPNPAPPIIDPTDIVPYTSFLLGTRPVGGLEEVMSKNHIMQVDRESAFGRIGWLEFRGALLESDVAQSLGGMSEQDAFELDGVVDTFALGLTNIAVDHDFTWVRYSQHRTLDHIEVVGKKVIKHYVYGPPVTIPIGGWSLRGIRTDNSAHQYFDMA